MRTITLIIIHCTGTKEGQHFTVRDVDAWHRARGWKNGCGYHYLVLLDGTIQQGRPEEMVGAHCLNHNQNSIGVCYVGGLKASPQPSPEGKGVKYVAADTRTPEQKRSLLSLLSLLKKKYPRALIVGHNVFANKACPCFDAANEYKELQPK